VSVRVQRSFIQKKRAHVLKDLRMSRCDEVAFHLPEIGDLRLSQLSHRGEKISSSISGMGRQNLPTHGLASTKNSLSAALA
jgi:hypothetical protein